MYLSFQWAHSYHIEVQMLNHSTSEAAYKQTGSNQVRSNLDQSKLVWNKSVFLFTLKYLDQNKWHMLIIGVLYECAIFVF